MAVGWISWDIAWEVFGKLGLEKSVKTEKALDNARQTLNRIIECEGRPVSILAGATYTQRVTFYRWLKKFEKAGLVKRLKGNKSGKPLLVYLTEKAWDTLEDYV